MKRKVALLLALVMIATMLPMNAFGAGIRHVGVPSQGWHQFHMELPIPALGAGNLIWPGNLGPVLTDEFQDDNLAVANRINPGAISTLLPITLDGARVFDAAGGAHMERRFIPRNPSNVIGWTPIINVTAHELVARQFGIGTVLLPGSVIPAGSSFGFMAVDAARIGRTWATAPITVAAWTDHADTHAAGNAALDDVVLYTTFNLVGGNFVIRPGQQIALTSVWNNIVNSAGTVIVANSVIMNAPAVGAIPAFGVPGAIAGVLEAAQRHVVHEYITFPPLGQHPAAEANRFHWQEWVRLNAVDPSSGIENPALGVFDVRFIPRWDSVARTWSNTQGWLDIRGVSYQGLPMLTVPQSLGLLRIPFAVDVERADATITVRRWDGHPNLMDGTMLLGGPQSLYGLPGDIVIPGALMTLAATPAPFSNVLGLNTLTLTETHADRIRNISVNEANAMGLANWWVYQTLTLRYAPVLMPSGALTVTQVPGVPAVTIDPLNTRFVITWTTPGGAATNVFFYNDDDIEEALYEAWGAWFANSANFPNTEFDWNWDGLAPLSAASQTAVDAHIALRVEAELPLQSAMALSRRVNAIGNGVWQTRESAAHPWVTLAGFQATNIPFGTWATQGEALFGPIVGSLENVTAPTAEGFNAANIQPLSGFNVLPTIPNIDAANMLPPGTAGPGGFRVAYTHAQISGFAQAAYSNIRRGLLALSPNTLGRDIWGGDMVFAAWPTTTPSWQLPHAWECPAANCVICAAGGFHHRVPLENPPLLAQGAVAPEVGFPAPGQTGLAPLPGNLPADRPLTGNWIGRNNTLNYTGNFYAVSTPWDTAALAIGDNVFGLNNFDYPLTAILPLLLPGTPAVPAVTVPAVGRFWWFLNGVEVAGPILVGTAPITPGVMLPSGQWEFPAGMIPFSTTSPDHARLLASRPEFGVTETGPNNLGWFTLRLVAPQYYTWHHAGIGGYQGQAATALNIWQDGWSAARFSSPVGNTAFRIGAGLPTNPPNQLNTIGTGPHAGNNFNVNFQTINGVERHVLYVRINAGDPTLTNFIDWNGVRNHIHQLGVLHLDGLQLFPTAQAPTTGEVAIDAYWGWAARLGNPWAAYRQMRSFGSIVVGNRGAANVVIGIVGDEPPAVQTGWLGNRVIGQPAANPGAALPAGQNPGNNNVDHYRGVRTAVVEIYETVPGILTTNWASPIEFTFDEGVKILGVVVNAGTNAANNNIINNFQGWLDATDMRFAAHQAHVRVDPYLVTINLPVASTPNINHRTRITVAFDISVEADFVHKYETDEIWVNISGTGIAAHGGGAARVLVAYASDPIGVTLDDDVVYVETDALFGVASQRLSDVRVTVYNTDVLANQSEIWLYLIDAAGARTEFFLDPGRVRVTPEGNYGGLQLAAPRGLEHPHPNFQRHGVAVTVNRQPSSVTDPFDIVFSDIYVTGRLVTGRDYMVAVSGTRIAQNDQIVRSAIQTPVGLGATIPALNAGTFTALPYARHILSQGDGGITVAPPLGVIGGNRLALREGMLPIDTNVSGDFQRVEDPFWLWENPADPRYVVSMLNPRVFADFIDGELDFANGVVNFSGFDANGNMVEVQLTTGSANAVVNGQTVDIAAFAGASGPIGSIQTINRNDRTFVPLRFLANAFLLDITFQEGTVFLER